MGNSVLMHLRRHRLPALGGLLISGALALAGCGGGGGDSVASAGEGSYKIALVVGLTGPAAQLGQHERDGAATAVKKINAAGGVNGRKIELVVRDGKADPSSTVSAFNDVVRDDSIVGLFGSTFGAATMAFKPLLDRAEIPVIAPTSTYGVTHPLNRWLFTNAMPAELQVRAVAESMQQAGLDNAAILSTTDGFGSEGAELLRKSGLRIAAAEEMDPATSDVTTQLTKLRAQNPDALIIWGTTPNTGIAIKNAGQLGMKLPIIAGNTGPTPENLKTASGSSALDRWLSVGVVDPDQPLDRQTEAVKRLTADHGVAPDIYTALGYDGLMLFAEALEKAGAQADRAKVRDALEGITGYASIGGVYSYSAQRHDGLGLDSVVWLKATKEGYRRIEDPMEVLAG